MGFFLDPSSECVDGLRLTRVIMWYLSEQRLEEHHHINTSCSDKSNETVFFLQFIDYENSRQRFFKTNRSISQLGLGVNVCCCVAFWNIVSRLLLFTYSLWQLQTQPDTFLNGPHTTEEQNEANERHLQKNAKMNWINSYDHKKWSEGLPVWDMQEEDVRTRVS